MSPLPPDNTSASLSPAPAPRSPAAPVRWLPPFLRRSVRPLGRHIASLISLRTRLLWVLLLAFVPAFTLIVRDHFEWEQQDHREISDEAMLNARLAAAGYERLLEGTRHVLLAFAQLESLQGPDPGAANKILRNFLKRYPTFLNIGVINSDGRLFASALPHDPRLDLSERHYFKYAMASNDFSVGKFQIGSVTHRPSLNCGFPMRDTAGKPRRVVFSALDLKWLNSMAGEVPVPPDARLLLLDREGAVLAVTPPTAAKIGEGYAHWNDLAGENGDGPSPTGGRRLLEDEEHLMTVSPVRLPAGSGLRVVYEISRQAAYRKAHFRLFLNLGLLLLSAFFVLVLGWAAGHLFITRHVTALLKATRRLADGDMNARTGVTGAPGELGQIAGAVDHLADALQKREEELRHTHANLERQVAERTQELRSSNEQLEAFSYSVSHDLRAPLRAIDGFSQILLNEHAENLTPEGKRLLMVVVKNTQQMSHLIENLLTFARLGRQDPHASPVDMAGLAREITDELLVAERHRRTSVEIAPLAPAVGDPAMIQQIWINLLSNALKFTSNTANVFISVGSKTGEGQNTYWIKDNGVGFDPKYAHRLFQVFQRLHSSSEFEGTGVGLAIVQRIVQKHGGRVWAESHPGEGATFYFTLPAGPAALGGKP